MHLALLELMGVRNGHFQLESGSHGSLWLELESLFVSPARIEPLIADLANGLSGHGAEAVCGPQTGGAFLAQSVASALRLDFFYAERLAARDRNGKSVVRYEIPAALRGLLAGKKVAIVDDAINAGLAMRSTFAELLICRAQPVAIGALLVLGEACARFCAEHKLAMESLAQLPNNLWLPSECPLCIAGVPLEDFTAPSQAGAQI